MHQYRNTKKLRGARLRGKDWYSGLSKWRASDLRTLASEGSDNHKAVALTTVGGGEVGVVIESMFEDFDLIRRLLHE